MPALQADQAVQGQLQRWLQGVPMLQSIQAAGIALDSGLLQHQTVAVA